MKKRIEYFAKHAEREDNNIVGIRHTKCTQLNARHTEYMGMLRHVFNIRDKRMRGYLDRVKCRMRRICVSGRV
jgi:hypothetical protein